MGHRSCTTRLLTQQVVLRHPFGYFYVLMKMWWRSSFLLPNHSHAPFGFFNQIIESFFKHGFSGYIRIVDAEWKQDHAFRSSTVYEIFPFLYTELSKTRIMYQIFLYFRRHWRRHIQKCCKGINFSCVYVIHVQFNLGFSIEKPSFSINWVYQPINWVFQSKNPVYRKTGFVYR